MEYRVHILKFGGSSVASGERIRRVADIITQAVHDPAAAFPVVVTSAMAGVTDTLLRVAWHALAGEQDAARNELAVIERRYREAAELVAQQDDNRRELLRDLESAYRAMEQDVERLHERQVAQHVQQEDSEQRGQQAALMTAEILAWGERLAILLVAAAVRDRGIQALAVREEVIITHEAQYAEMADMLMSAEPLGDETRANAQRLLHPLIERGIVPVVAGFIGRSSGGHVTTLGRNGSDYSAALVGKALDCTEISIYTDVDGILSADPRVVENARLLPGLSYGEAARLSWFGAQVLHPRTLIPAAQQNIPIHVRNTFRPKARGTVVGPEQIPCAAVAVRGRLALVVVESATGAQPPHKRANGLHSPGSYSTGGEPVNVGRVFDVTAGAGAEPVTICASSGHYLSFLVEEQAADAVVARLQQHGGSWRIACRRGLAACACIGSNIARDPMNVARAIAALARAGITVVTQGASPAGMVLVVDDREGEHALRSLHQTLISGESLQLCHESEEWATRQVATAW